MKKYFYFILSTLLLTTFPLSSQTVTHDNESADSSIIYDGSAYNFIFSWKKKATESHWTGLGFTFSDLNGLEDVDLKLGKSYSVRLNMADYTLPINHHWLFFTGVGLDWTRYHFKGNIGLQDINGIAQFVPDEFGRNYKSSKLLAYYITIPLALEYQTKIGKGKMFFVQGGAEGLIKYYSKSQVDIRTDDGIKKVNHKDLNILPLNFRLFLKAGFNDVSVIGYYQPVSMFEKGKGPDIQPYGLGIMLNF
ncbi:MAG: hypothetical protein LIO93_00745 [Bacteroidales bacterium]|nr:hypothetical protein [Bacteroidales bacterium]